MSESKSKFFSSSDHPTKTYLQERAEYLEARGCTVQQLKGVDFCEKDFGLLKKLNSEYVPFTPEGFAFRVRGPDGEYHDGSFLLRPCNWPEEPLFRKENGEFKLYKDRPKFLHIGDECINWVSTLNECATSPHIAIHEKNTCAALSLELLGIPSIALSGCCNWSKNGKLNPDLRRLFLTMNDGATIYICFDGDIRTNTNVLHASHSLKGWIEALRPDLNVVFPQVPEGFNGWDDYVVSREDRASAVVDWLKELGGQGVDITGFIPTPVLIDQFGLAFKVVKEKVRIVHTASNYGKIYSLHPTWTNFIVNIDDQIYDINDPSQHMEITKLGNKVEIWLAECVFPGGDGESISHPKIVRGIEEVMCRPDREVSLPHHVIRSFGDPPTEEQARVIVRRLFTEGIKVTGPMTEDELVETFLRVMRDMVGMWSHDWKWCPQWMFAILGPSGAGKTDFTKSLLRCMSDAGFKKVLTKISTTGAKSTPEEITRILQSTLVGQVDEYNPPSGMGKAKEFEDMLLSFCSERISPLRRMRENTTTPAVRAGSIFITTTDKNRQFLRSGKDEGAERRAIVIEVVGVVLGPDGKMTSDRSKVAEFGRELVKWGLWAYENKWKEGLAATEFSIKYASAYLEEDDTLRNVGKLWARGDAHRDLEERGAALYREGSGDWRLSPSQLYEILFPGERTTREQGAKLKALAIECGAVEIGKARVNPLMKTGRETTVDKAFLVADWKGWCDALRAKLGA